jgi:predicted RND superfamily exporter protein
MLAPEVIRLERDLGRFMLQDPSVSSIISVAPDIIEPYNQMFHYGNPKYLAVPRTADDAMGLYLLFIGGTAPGEAEQWIDLNSNDGILRVLLSDHTYSTLNNIQARLAEFVQRRKWDPAFKKVEIVYLGGIAGLYAAANDVLYQLDFINITFVLGVVFLFCAVVYRSIVAGVLFVVSCIAANFAAFIYMRMADIGITIDTIPVISLGIGLGVDYGIYAVSRICDECAEGRRLEDAITTALRGTGAAVLATFSVIVGGLAPWVFSPVLFHNEMSVLLIILMSTNVIVGLLILPAYIAWARPRFIFGGVAEEELRKETMAAVSS